MGKGGDKMDKSKRIETIRTLKNKKGELKRKLSTIEEQLEMEKELCNHIGVNLGNNVCQCLICGVKSKESFFDSKYMVHAEDYLANFDIGDEKQCNEKFDTLQTMALGLLRDNPSMDNLELTTRFNHLIEESHLQREENLKQGKQLLKDKR